MKLNVGEIKSGISNLLRENTFQFFLGLIVIFIFAIFGIKAAFNIDDVTAFVSNKNTAIFLFVRGKGNAFSCMLGILIEFALIFAIFLLCSLNPFTAHLSFVLLAIKTYRCFYFLFVICRFLRASCILFSIFYTLFTIIWLVIVLFYVLYLVHYCRNRCSYTNGIRQLILNSVPFYVTLIATILIYPFLLLIAGIIF